MANERKKWTERIPADIAHIFLRRQTNRRPEMGVEVCGPTGSLDLVSAVDKRQGA